MQNFKTTTTFTYTLNIHPLVYEREKKLSVSALLSALVKDDAYTFYTLIMGVSRNKVFSNTFIIKRLAKNKCKGVWELFVKSADF